MIREIKQSTLQLSPDLRRWVLALSVLLSACAAPITPTLTVKPTETMVRVNTATAIPTFTPTVAPTSIPIIISPTTTPPNMKTITEKLIAAAEKGETATVLQLLKDGADINGRDARGRTPVMAATHGNKVETVRALINAGANINLQDNLKDNPFLYAGAEGLLEILRLTIAAKADTRITNRYGGTALIPAAERGHVEVVNEILTRTDVNVNHINNLGWTALLEAIILGDGGARRTEVVRLLVKAGANVNLADKDGVTPLAHARQRGYKQMIEILENAGAH